MLNGSTKNHISVLFAINFQNPPLGGHKPKLKGAPQQSQVSPDNLFYFMLLHTLLYTIYVLYYYCIYIYFYIRTLKEEDKLDEKLSLALAGWCAITRRAIRWPGCGMAGPQSPATVTRTELQLLGFSGGFSNRKTVTHKFCSQKHRNTID